MADIQRFPLSQNTPIDHQHFKSDVHMHFGDKLTSPSPPAHIPVETSILERDRQVLTRMKTEILAGRHPLYKAPPSESISTSNGSNVQEQRSLPAIDKLESSVRPTANVKSARLPPSPSSKDSSLNAKRNDVESRNDVASAVRSQYTPATSAINFSDATLSALTAKRPYEGENNLKPEAKKVRTTADSLYPEKSRSPTLSSASVAITYDTESRRQFPLPTNGYDRTRDRDRDYRIPSPNIGASRNNVDRHRPTGLPARPSPPLAERRAALIPPSNHLSESHPLDRKIPSQDKFAGQRLPPFAKEMRESERDPRECAKERDRRRSRSPSRVELEPARPATLRYEETRTRNNEREISRNPVRPNNYRERERESDRLPASAPLPIRARSREPVLRDFDHPKYPSPIRRDYSPPPVARPDSRNLYVAAAPRRIDGRLEHSFAKDDRQPNDGRSRIADIPHIRPLSAVPPSLSSAPSRPAREELNNRSNPVTAPPHVPPYFVDDRRAIETLARPATYRDSVRPAYQEDRFSLQHEMRHPVDVVQPTSQDKRISVASPSHREPGPLLSALPPPLLPSQIDKLERNRRLVELGISTAPSAAISAAPSPQIAAQSPMRQIRPEVPVAPAYVPAQPSDVLAQNRQSRLYDVPDPYLTQTLHARRRASNPSAQMPQMPEASYNSRATPTYGYTLQRPVSPYRQVSVPRHDDRDKLYGQELAYNSAPSGYARDTLMNPEKWPTYRDKGDSRPFPADTRMHLNDRPSPPSSAKVGPRHGLDRPANHTISSGTSSREDAPPRDAREVKDARHVRDLRDSRSRDVTDRRAPSPLRSVPSRGSLIVDSRAEYKPSNDTTDGMPDRMSNRGNLDGYRQRSVSPPRPDVRGHGHPYATPRQNAPNFASREYGRPPLIPAPSFTEPTPVNGKIDPYG